MIHSVHVILRQNKILGVHQAGVKLIVGVPPALEVHTSRKAELHKIVEKRDQTVIIYKPCLPHTIYYLKYVLFEDEHQCLYQNYICILYYIFISRAATSDHLPTGWPFETTHYSSTFTPKQYSRYTVQPHSVHRRNNPHPTLFDPWNYPDMVRCRCFNIYVVKMQGGLEVLYNSKSLIYIYIYI